MLTTHFAAFIVSKRTALIIIEKIQTYSIHKGITNKASKVAFRAATIRG